ncbi:DUF7146 domain-containing protein [Phaeospirillum tilakii]|uniref:Toprim domain-containing protein n=1 Tax=Phaeospirillum tilakii TaxID=741673 RepID=A0ABW5CEF3_9PROT
MVTSAHDLARSLAERAEAVCRVYLFRGRRQGAWWCVGNVLNHPGRSLYVRLTGDRAGKWTDASTGEHGDLLDLIALNRGLDPVSARDEARVFLALPQVFSRHQPVASGSSDAARRLFRQGQPVAGTLAEAYLRARGITGRLDLPALRFHPALWYRPHPDAPRQSWPALLAAVTDGVGRITGLQRTWLDRDRAAKAPLATPRRALGHLLGNAVHFGPVADLLAAGEGIETMLAVRSALPTLPVVAALSANHLAAFAFPPGLVRLYVARDNDPAGRKAVARLIARGAAQGLEVRPLLPWGEDFNADLLRFGPDWLRAHLAGQLVPEDERRLIDHRSRG